MTRKEFLQHYWRYYLVLEEKFKNTLNYIELDWQNAGTFSNCMLCCCNQLEQNWIISLRCIVGLPLKIEKT